MWRTIQASFASPHHPDTCLDSVRACSRDDGLTLLCVADGAGDEATSLRASRLAAQLAQESFLRLAATSSRELLGTLKVLVAHVTEKFFEITGSDPVHDNNYNTTLAIALLADDWIALASVGDAFAVLATEHDFDLVLCPDRPAGVSSPAAYMIADWIEHTQYVSVWDPGARCLLLSTDGLEKFLVYRSVAATDGVRKQVPFGVNKYLSNAIDQFATGKEELGLEAIGRPDVRSFKSDDVGIAVGYR